MNSPLILSQILFINFLILFPLKPQAAVVKGKLISRHGCNAISSVNKFKINGELVYEKYATQNGEFIIENLPKGVYTFEFQCLHHYSLRVTEIVVDKDTLNLPPFRIHAIVYHNYDDRPRRGFRPRKSYFDNDVLAAEGRYKFIFRHPYYGLCKTYKHGLWKYYYEDGKLQVELEFKEGSLHGMIRELQSNGNPLFEGHAEKGKGFRGKWIYYDLDVEIDAVGIFKKGEHTSIFEIKLSDIKNESCVPFSWRG